MLYLFLIFFLLYVIKKNKEDFNLGIGKSFAEYIHPQKCLPENNCFRGSYTKNSIYQNVTQPIFTLLNRIKIPLYMDSIRILR